MIMIDKITKTNGRMHHWRIIILVIQPCLEWNIINWWAVELFWNKWIQRERIIVGRRNWIHGRVYHSVIVRPRSI